MCIIGLAAFGYTVYGFGQPNTYWYRLGAVQVFEGEEGLIAFVQLDLVTHRPGLVRSPPNVSNPVSLDRMDISRDGFVSRHTLKSPADIHQLRGIEDILKLPEGLFLVERPSLRQPSLRVHRILEDRIEFLSEKEACPILRSSGFMEKLEGDVSRITELHGWHLIEKGSPKYSSNAPIISLRFRMQRRISGEDQAEQTIVAESTGEGDRWAVPTLKVKTRRWRSYHGATHER